MRMTYRECVGRRSRAMEGRSDPTFFRFEVNRVHQVCFDQFAQLRTGGDLDPDVRLFSRTGWVA